MLLNLDPKDGLVGTLQTNPANNHVMAAEGRVLSSGFRMLGSSALIRAAVNPMEFCIPMSCGVCPAWLRPLAPERSRVV